MKETETSDSDARQKLCGQNNRVKAVNVCSQRSRSRLDRSDVPRSLPLLLFLLPVFPRTSLFSPFELSRPLSSPTLSHSSAPLSNSLSPLPPSSPYRRSDCRRGDGDLHADVPLRFPEAGDRRQVNHHSISRKIRLRAMTRLLPGTLICVSGLVMFLLCIPNLRFSS